jgi:hypothetical protein
VTGRLTRAAEFKYFLWRRHKARRALRGSLPEVLATDGEVVRRLCSRRDHIVYQEFDDARTAAFMIERVEASATPGVAIAGYSMLKDQDSVAILHTAPDLKPGWAAFPQDAWIPRSDAQRITLPDNIKDIPRMRLVAGAGVYWMNRELVIHAALEQRGSSFARSRSAFNILDHLKSWRIATIAYRNGEQRVIEAARSPEPIGEVARVRPTRSEVSFAIEPSIYKEFKHMDHQVWFELKFDRELFCLPEDWSSFWLSVDLVEPPGMVL